MKDMRINRLSLPELLQFGNLNKRQPLIRLLPLNPDLGVVLSPFMSDLINLNNPGRLFVKEKLIKPLNHDFFGQILKLLDHDFLEVELVLLAGNLVDHRGFDLAEVLVLLGFRCDDSVKDFLEFVVGEILDLGSEVDEELSGGF